jgi:two-component SAPR family response regulator
VGGDNELPLLKKILLTDKNAHVRTDTAAALSQIFFRLPELKEKISIILQEALKQERDEEAQRSIISSLQDVLSQKFGLRFNYEEGEIVGNTANALKKAYSYLGIK